jgi:disulfide oxidoreductase YuzD
MKTAVEWLEDCLREQYPNGKFVWNTRADIEALFKRAKEMEKQQIIEAHGNKEKKSGGVTNYTYILTGEEYYNENFKNN